MRVKHSGNSGDIIHSLAAVKQLIKRENAKECTYLLQLDVPAKYAPGLVHPLGNFLLTEKYAEMMFPLLESQGFKTGIYDTYPVDFDLDLFRDVDWDLGRGDLRRVYGYVFHCQIDQSQPYLDVPADDRFKDTILFNRTSRYQANINYSFLKDIKCAFIGLPAEWIAFCKEFKIDMPFNQAVDFLELARWIKGCRAFVGNQSLCFAIAEALKVPRALEVYLRAPNVVVCGANGWDYCTQHLAELIVKQLAGIHPYCLAI
jgi:hypothetical protein